MLENKFKTKLSKKIESRLPGAMVLHLDPNERQGIPDLLVLYGNNWAALEVKKGKNEHHQPNQDYYVDAMGKMSFSAFIFPENEEEILNAMEQSFQARR